MQIPPATYTRQFRRLTTGLALLLAGGLGTAAQADPCAVPASAGEDVVISAVRDDNRLLLADGRLLQIAGLDRATLRLPPLAGKQAVLILTGEPDRNGARHASLSIDGDDLASTLLAQGLARLRPVPDKEVCDSAMRQAEIMAITARTGLWAEPRFAIRNAADSAAISGLAGEFIVATGRIRHVGITKNTIWLDFGTNWRNDMAVRIPRRSWPRFEAAGLTRERLQGSDVRVRGVVVMQGGPRIDITEPAAIERL